MCHAKNREVDADWVRLEMPGVEMKTLFKDQASGCVVLSHFSVELDFYLPTQS